MHEFEDFIEHTCNLQSEEDVLNHLQNTVHHDGYQNVVFVQVGQNGHIEVPLRRLPKGYDEAYVLNKWHQIDPVLQFTNFAYTPFKWEELKKKKTLSKAQLRFFEECRELGVHSGFTIPIHAPGRRDVISVSLIDQDDVDPSRLPIIHAKAMQAWVRYCELTKHEDTEKAPVYLTERERDCLRWIKAGKTCEDTAEILKISPKTVEHHLRSARQKLGVTSTLTAVVKSIQYGLLEL